MCAAEWNEVRWSGVEKWREARREIYTQGRSE